MAWILLGAAGVLEVVWALALKQSDGLTRAPQAVTFLVALAASMALLAKALTAIPVGTGYAVWTGIGAVGTVTAGVILLDEPASALRLASVALIVIGIAGLGLAGSH